MNMSGKVILIDLIYKLFTLGLKLLFLQHLLHSLDFRIEPQHKISNNVVCATSKGSDQPVHTCSLIRAFACHLNIL